MIWHIVKKDLKLWWPLALGLSSVHWLLDLMMLSRGRFGFDFYTGELSSGFTHISNLLGWVGILASGVVCTVIVQEDRLPGVRQDWLVRPIRRLDLLAAKFVTVLILVLLPTFLADFTEVSLSGFFARGFSRAADAARYLAGGDAADSGCGAGCNHQKHHGGDRRRGGV